MMEEDIIEFVSTCLKGDRTGHDMFHVERVAKLAGQMYCQDNYGNLRKLELIELMSYLHDTIDEKLTNKIAERTQQIKELSTVKYLSLEDQINLFDIIQHMSYAQNLKSHYQLSIEGQYVQDADWLDALGAIGIARAFTYGGSHAQPIYDHERPISYLSSAEYHQHKGSTINHFYEKLLKLEGLMNTESGKKIAHQRTLFMCNFLREFDAEIK